MQETKIFTQGGLNYDTEFHLLPANDWVSAINMRMAASDEQEQGSATNLEGNVRIGTYEYATGTNICIGCYADEFRNTVIAFICNSNNFDEIVEINPESGYITPVFKNLVWTNNVDVTQFEPQNKIHSIDIIHRSEDEGDLIFWTDGASRPRKINKLRGLTFGTATGYPTPILYEYTTVAKEPPRSPMVQWLSDLDRGTNNVKGKLFQFQVRYQYDDFEKSVWTGWSNYTIPLTPFDKDRDSDPTINNYINVVFTTGNELVTKIELGVRQNIASQWGDLFLVETFDKVKLSIGNNTTYAYRFYNDVSGVLQIPAETGSIYDYVPTSAGCQALVNGNVLAYGDIVEGLNFDGNMDVAMQSYQYALLTINEGDNVLGYKFSSKYRFGLVYFDEYNRTDGVHNYQPNADGRTFEVNTVGYVSDNVATNVYNVYAPIITAAIFHTPPIWAKTYKWVRTNFLTCSKYFYYVARPIGTGDVDNIYFYFDPITASITANGQLALSYDFAPGDRLRIVRQMDNGPQNMAIDLEIVNLLKDPTVANVQYLGNYLKVAKNTAAAMITTASYLVEIYSPSSIASNDVYYEFGQEYNILNPGTNNRYHAGQIQNQTAILPATFEFRDNGDVYYRKRERMHVYDGSIDQNFDNIPVSDVNFSDKYRSGVNGNGRPYIVDDNIKEQRLPNDIRFGGAYVQDTFINKTNNFPAANIISNIDRSFGIIKRLTVRDRQLRVFQELKCGWLPIQQQVLSTSNGTPIVSQSDKLLNDIQYYLGDFGIGNAPCSLATKNFSDYFHDTNRGVICRLSRDGVTPISITAFMNRFAITEDIKYKNSDYVETGFVPPFVDDIPGRANIYGVFDTRNNTYLSTYSEIATYTDLPSRTVVNPAKTISWDEVRNRFISDDIKFHPEWMTSLKNDLITFKSGIPYIHNDKVNRCNFYGQNFDWGMKLVFNDKFAIKKSYEYIDVLSNIIISIPEITTPINNGSGLQNSNLIESDFRLLEGHYHSNFLRDVNSPGGLINGDSLKGAYITAFLKVESAQSLISLRSVEISYILSQKNTQ